MNPSSSHLKFACRVVRTGRAIFETFGADHLVTCAGCQEFFRASGALDSALRQRAPARFSPPATLERRICLALRNEAHFPRTPALAQHWSGRWALGATVAAIAAIALFVPRREAMPSGRGIGEPDVAAVADAVKSFSNEFIVSVLPTAGAMVAQNPLQRELDSIYSDAQSALGFLKLNFLPSRIDQPTPRSG